MLETIRMEMSRTPIDTHKYLRKRYLTLDGVDQILSYLKSQIEQMPLLTPEELERIVRDWVNEDWATRSIQLSRGHWEYIAPVIAQAQKQDILNKL